MPGEPKGMELAGQAGEPCSALPGPLAAYQAATHPYGQIVYVELKGRRIMITPQAQIGHMGWSGPGAQAWAAQITRRLRAPEPVRYAARTTVLYTYVTQFPDAAHALTQAMLVTNRPPRTSMEVEWTGADPFAYGKALFTRWHPEHNLVTVEQDIVVRPDVLLAFEECPSPWCVFPYQTFACELEEGLGCTRFRAQAMALATPYLIGAIPGECELCGGIHGCWRHLDCKIAWTLRAFGLEPCVHRPAVEHLNPNAHA